MNNINIDNSKCLKPCSGLIVTSLSKDVPNKEIDNLLHSIIEDYNKYKIITHYPAGFAPYGRFKKHKTYLFILIFLGYKWENTLRFVRIFFDTPTFDRIEKDRAAKFEDKLSAIGGTMGLLTGFSVISAVEILYFAVKIVLNLLKKNNLL